METGPLTISGDTVNSQESEFVGMSVSDAVLSLISTIIGGGMLGIPFAFYHLGIILGSVLIVVVGLITQHSIYLYLQSKDLLPLHLESLFDIGFMLIGKKSIYIVSSAQFVMCSGLMMVYFIVFGDILSSMMSQLVFTAEEDKCTVFTSRTFYIVLLGAVCFPFIIKKELKELKVASIILFTGVACFIIIMLSQLLIEGNKFNKDKSYSAYLYPNNYSDAIKGSAMLMTAYGF